MATSTLRQWPVVLSGRAIRELRLLSEDKRTLEIVRTKLKEISHGQFTSDNHLPVRGSTEYIPVYRARTSNDLRIIYMIDLVADGQNKFDHQVIKVFSVSSRARVAYDFWVKVSKFLVQHGAEYRHRCLQRDVVNTPNGPISVPASFDHKEYVLVVANPEAALDAETSMNELHETVVLEKFTPVTKSLYNSILADMEAVLPMALNPDEKAIVRHHGTSVVIGRSGTGKTTALIYKMRANSQLGALSDSLRPTRQLFVTRSKVLTQHIASNYRGLIDSSEIANKSDEELEEIRKSNQKYQNRELVEFDNEVDLREDLPRRFSQLTEANFPLFVSFDKLCDLLEADTHPEEDALMATKARTRRLVTFSDFKHHYWPTFDYKSTRHMDPALVYSEILGVIKGYGRNLSKDEYLTDLSYKKSPLLADVRHQVYAIFEAYTKQSCLRGEIDAADRTRMLLQKYKVTNNSQVDYIFVDEVQDHLMADVYLIQSLCSNLDGGYWCGDTAQTINIGSSFRIKDLKAYIYESMLPIAKDESHHRQRKAAAPFSTFELTVNFRSHGGIVRYAASLVELIYTLFPSSIDHMQPESAKTPGMAPLLFVSPVEDEASFVQYLLDQKSADEAAPFGAQQAIIVRSESTAQSLTDRLRKRCTVLTLRETKGLEFDDLILYNFFAESEAPSSAWRIILGLSVTSENGRVQYTRPDLSTSISPVLCSELKQLYVAVTRARHRCWLWDSGTTIDLMKGFWENLNLITISDSLESLSRFAASSKDLRQWAYRGQEFFSTGLYSLAVSCFERAGQVKEAAIADAYQHMTEAKMLSMDSLASKNALIKAAEKMKACATFDGQNPSHSSATLWYHAATCFEAAQEIPRASHAYCQGRFYDQAALVLFESQDMDGCLRIWVKYSNVMDQALVQRIKDVASLHYLRERKYSQLQSLFHNNLRECIDFARALKFSAQLKDLLRMNRQFEDLAAAHLDDGLPVEAIRCLLQNSKSDSTIEKSGRIVSTYLWMNFGFDTVLDKKSIEQAVGLIDIATTSLGGLSERPTRHDIAIFSKLIDQAEVSLEWFQEILEDLDPTDEEDRLRATLIQHHALKSSDWISHSSHCIFTAYLRAWPEYVAGLRNIETLQNPSQDKAVRLFLGLSDTSKPSSASGRMISIPKRSFLLEYAAKGRSGKKASGRDTVVPANDADAAIQSALSEHLKKGLLGLHSNLIESPWTQVYAHWTSDSAGRSAAPDNKVAMVPRPGEQIHSFALAFLALDMVKEHNISLKALAKVDGAENLKIQILWIMRLFAVVFPSTGTINNISPALSRIAPITCASIFTWVNEVLKSLDPLKHKGMFVSLLVVCLALASDLQPNCIPVKRVPKIPWKKGVRPSIPRGCPDQPDRFTENICTLFQHKHPARVPIAVDTILQTVEKKITIDISIMVHLVEQVVRELTVAARVANGRQHGGYSGLIAPVSWIANLLMATKGRTAPVPAKYSIDKLINRVGEIINQLSTGIPEHWQLWTREYDKHILGSIAIRLIWAVSIVAVNLHPAHPSLRSALNVVKLGILEQDGSRSPMIDDFETMGIDPTLFHRVEDQPSCLSALSQTLRHEELVMLSSDGALICPAKQHLVHRVIPFDSYTDLCAKLLNTPNEEPATPGGQPGLQTHEAEPASLGTTSEPSFIITEPLAGPLAEPLAEPITDTFEAPELTAIEHPDRPDTPSSLSELEADSLEEDEVKTVLTPDEAASRIQLAWTKSVKRQQLRQQLSKFDEEGRCYERYRHIFPKLGKSPGPRELLRLRLVRGPCLSVVLALEMLVDEMVEYLEQVGEALKTPGLNPKELASLQKRIEGERKLVEGYKTKAQECLPQNGTPKVFQVPNPGGIKIQTKKAWDVFIQTKNSKKLPYDDTFVAIERSITYGKGLILDSKI